jgi:hypothetical protein
VKKIFELLLLAAAVVMVGCETAPAPDVLSYTDDFSGLRTDLMGENLLETKGQPSELVWLNASRIFKSRNQSEYYLEVTYLARTETGRIEIPPGDSLSIIADGQLMRFSSSGSLLKTAKSGFVRETAIYVARPDQLQRIANARSVHVEVRGRTRSVQRDFSEVNFDRFRRFVMAYAM